MSLAPPLSLADGFPVPTEEDWKALVAKTLGPSVGGADDDPLLQIMVRLDDLNDQDGHDWGVYPLYSDETAHGPCPLRHAEAADPLRDWDVRSLIDDPEPARANADALSDLKGGATSLTIAVDPSIWDGVCISSRDELARVLDGVMLDIAPVGLKAGYLGADAAMWLANLAKGAPAASLAFNLDPLGAFANQGRSSGPFAPILDRHIGVAMELVETYPRASLFMASGVAAHEQGGSVGQELGLMLACALAYAKALTAAGKAMQPAFEGVTFCLTAEADSFFTLAKFRAGRLLATGLASACGAEITPRIEARASRRMLSRLDTWTNLLRLTSACAGAAMGGADIIQLETFTFPLTSFLFSAAEGRPSKLARRLARNTQLILMEESGLARVADPAGGSWMLESLTLALAERGWAEFQAIEAEGGALAALKLGKFHSRIERVRKRRFRAINRGDVRLIGVNDFADLDGVEPEVERWRKAPRGKRIRELAPRANDDKGVCFAHYPSAEAYESLRSRSRRIAKAAAYLVTLGEPPAARVAFAKTLFLSGGFTTTTGPLDAYDPGSTPVAILCGPDEAYAAHGASTAKALKAAGAKRILVVQEPGAREKAMRKAGVDDFVFPKCDAFDALHHTLKALEPMISI